MGAAPSQPTDEQDAELREKLHELVERAACAIATADCCLVATGAGWSADSGLAVYKDVANVEAYQSKGLSYHDLCDPQVLADTPDLFLGFWGGCFNDYRATPPHAGYRTIAKWRDEYFPPRGPISARLKELLDRDDPSFAGPFFSLTSNVDAHWLRDGHFTPTQVYECHGNLENWQCVERGCSQALSAETPPDHAAITDGSWRAPDGHAFAVGREDRLAADGAPAALGARAVGSGCAHDEAAFASNHPRCVVCNGPARPAVLMFQDATWAPNVTARKRFERWHSAVLKMCKKGHGAGAPPKLVVLEIGCGNNVTTIRNKTESLVRKAQESGAQATLIRINPDFPLADSDAVRPFTLPILSRGLAAIERIDAALQRRSQAAGATGGEPGGLLELEDPMAGLRFEHISSKAEEAPPRHTAEADEEGRPHRRASMRAAFTAMAQREEAEPAAAAAKVECSAASDAGEAPWAAPEASDSARQRTLVAEMSKLLVRCENVKQRASDAVDESIERYRRGLVSRGDLTMP